MRSFDYCHFEVCLSTDFHGLEDQVKSTDELRKTAQRLADKAVKQYQIAKTHEARRANSKYDKEALTSEVKRIMDKPEGDRSPNELAKVKALNDAAYWERREAEYNYDDDYDDEDTD